MLNAIDRRLHNDYAIQASLHGLKVPLKYNSNQTPPVQSFSPEEQARIDKVMRDGQRRVKARYV